MPQPEPQVMNFQFAPSPWGSMFDSYGKMKEAQDQQIQNEMNRMKMPYIAPQQQAVLQNQQLQNQDLQAQAKYWDQNYANDAQIKQVDASMAEQMKRAEIASKQSAAARAQQQLRNPSIGSDPASQYRHAEYLESIGDTEGAKFVMDAARANMFARTTPEERGAGRLPASEKVDSLATMKGIGYSAIEAQRLMDQGIDIYQAGEKKGLSREQVDNVEKEYAPPAAVISQMQRSLGGAAEDEVSGPFIADSIGKYYDPLLPNIADMPPKFLLDQLTGQNREDRINYLSATQLVMEQASVRLKTAQAEAGITAIEHMLKQTTTDLPAPKKVPAQDWADAQKKTSEKISEMGNAYRKAITNPKARKKEKLEKSLEKDIERETLEADAISRGFKQVNGKWVKQ